MRDMSKAFQDRRALLGRFAGLGTAAAFMPLAACGLTVLPPCAAF